MGSEMCIRDRSTIRCSPSLTKRAPAGRTGGFLGARAAHAAAFVRMREGAATRRGLQCFSEPRSTGFWSATFPLSQAGHCAARGSRAHHRLDQLADWPRSAVRFPIKCSNHELSYALLARARESFELCSHFKSLPPVSDRELSADLTWRAHTSMASSPSTLLRSVIGDEGALGPAARIRPDSQHGEEPLHVHAANDVSRAPTARAGCARPWPPSRSSSASPEQSCAL